MHLLIDGKNLLYRSLYASYNNGSDHIDRFVVISRFLHTYYTITNPHHVHVFWDAPGSTVWRKKLYPEYKDGRIPHDNRIGNDLKLYQKICISVWKYMGIRQYFQPAMEADDLIYAFCHHNRRSQCIIASSDKDLLQIPYYNDNTSLLDPQTRKIVPRPIVNPIDTKCLGGDKSDNINGYYRIGKVKSKAISQDNIKMKLLLEDKGDEIYRLNRALIDLSLCPYVLKNILYIINASGIASVFDKDRLKELFYDKYKLKGMVREFTKTILPFCSIAEEIRDGDTCGVHDSNAGS